MTRLIPSLAITAASAALIASLTACGAPQSTAYAPVAYDDDLYESALCIDDRSGLRVPDNYCPTGDGITNGAFRWVYAPYSALDDADDIDVVYVGYPVDRVRYVTTHNPRVRTYNIDRGRAPEYVRAGQPAVASARIPRAPSALQRKTVVRGGLGTPGARSTNVPTPPPNRAGAAPGPTNRALPGSGSSAAASAGTSGPRGSTAVPKPAAANTAPVAKPAAIPAPPASRPSPPAVRSAPVKTGK